ncbi:MAG: glycosyltransferase family 9 protein, partial [Dissulfurispiraceae bacterium]
QKGAGEDEAAHPPPGLSLIHLGSMIEDFADAAAIVASLDLVICVDTAMAHLAGALGKPCWVLLPYYKTDWRWLTGRTDSPWYPGVMRLFRQPEIGNWTSVIAEVGVALEQFAQEQSLRHPTGPAS